MNWLAALKLIADVVSLLLRAADWIEREKIVGDALQQQARETMERIDAEVAKAEAARAGVRAELDADPERLRDPEDRFRRPD